MKSILVVCMLLSFSTMAQPYALLITGTYTNGKSEGIYVHRINTKTLEATQLFIAKGIKNPSFIAVSPDKKFVYAVEEVNGDGNSGRVVSYRFDKNEGTLLRINDKPSGGDDPCYIITDKSGRWVIAGNYSSGSLAVLPVSKVGELGSPVTTIRHEGKGTNSERQEKPHVHSTVLNEDNTFLYVPDLGIDRVMIYAFNKTTGALTPASSPFVSVKPGSGPRHFEFSQNGRNAYLIEELTGTVSVFAVNKQNGALNSIQSISGAKPGFNEFMGSADIHLSPDGKFLYTSNRGDANDISIFSVNGTNGKLTYVTSAPVLGKQPRNFCIDPSGNLLLAANQKTGEIVFFQRDKKTGRLTDSGKKILVPEPVCLKWVTL